MATLPELSFEANKLKCEFEDKQPSGLKFRWRDDGKPELCNSSVTRLVSDKKASKEEIENIGTGKGVGYHGNYVIVEFPGQSAEYLKSVFSSE